MCQLIKLPISNSLICWHFIEDCLFCKPITVKCFFNFIKEITLKDVLNKTLNRTLSDSENGTTYYKGLIEYSKLKSNSIDLIQGVLRRIKTFNSDPFVKWFYNLNSIRPCLTVHERFQIRVSCRECRANSTWRL